MKPYIVQWRPVESEVGAWNTYSHAVDRTVAMDEFSSPPEHVYSRSWIRIENHSENICMWGLYESGIVRRAPIINSFRSRTLVLLAQMNELRHNYERLYNGNYPDLMLVLILQSKIDIKTIIRMNCEIKSLENPYLPNRLEHEAFTEQWIRWCDQQSSTMSVDDMHRILRVRFNHLWYNNNESSAACQFIFNEQHSYSNDFLLIEIVRIFLQHRTRVGEMAINRCITNIIKRHIPLYDLISSIAC